LDFQPLTIGSKALAHEKDSYLMHGVTSCSMQMQFQKKRGYKFSPFLVPTLRKTLPDVMNDIEYRRYKKQP